MSPERTMSPSAMTRAVGPSAHCGRPGDWLNGRLSLFILLLPAVVLAADTGHPIIGAWKLPTYPASAPEECHDATIEFGVDGSLTIRSGDQVVTGVYRLESLGDDAYMLVQWRAELPGLGCGRGAGELCPPRLRRY